MKKLKEIPEINNLVEIEKARNSYIKKSDFIKLITEMKFDTIERADITFNTAYEYDTENKKVKTIGYEIRIS